MSITSISYRLFAWVRRSEVFLSSQSIAAPVVDLAGKCPQHAAFSEVRVTGSSTIGLVRLTGTVDGAPTVEELVFDGNTSPSSIRVGCIRGLCVDSVEVLGFAPDATITGRYVGAGGEAVPVDCMIEPCVKASQEYAGAGKWAANVPGPHERASGWIAFDDQYSSKPRPGDVFVEINEDDSYGARWEVTGRPNWLGVMRRHHWEVDVFRVDTTDIA